MTEKDQQAAAQEAKAHRAKQGRVRYRPRKVHETEAQYAERMGKSHIFMATLMAQSRHPEDYD